MMREFNLKSFQVVNCSNIFWIIHFPPTDWKCQYIHGPGFFLIFYFCSKDLFIYSCANITLYLLKLLYNMFWHLVGQNFARVSSFFKLSWLLRNIHSSFWILESACQIPLKSRSGFDWDCVEFIDLLRGLKWSKNINS